MVVFWSENISLYSYLQLCSLLCSDTDIQLLFVLGKAEGNIASDYLIDLLGIQKKVALKHSSRS